jgi:hypothetical protein
MELPRQVEEAANIAEELMQGIQQAPQQEAQEEEVQTQEETVQENETSEEQDVPHDDDVQELRKFKDRYLSLKGKYDAEVPRLHQELREFKQSVFERLAPQTPKEEKKVENDKIAKFKEEYGEEFVESLRELLKVEVDPLIKSNVSQVEQQVASVEDTQIKAAQQNFASYLDTKVQNNWREIAQVFNEIAYDQPVSNPKIAEFLSKPDPSGYYTNFDLVKIFNDNWDGDKLANVFNSYYEQAPKPKPKNNPVQDAMVAPSRSTQHVAPTASDKTIWTKEMIAQFEKDDRMGKFSSEDSQAKWNDLLSAAAEGRIR